MIKQWRLKNTHQLTCCCEARNSLLTCQCIKIGLFCIAISMAQWKTAASPLLTHCRFLTHWRYCSRTLSHRYEVPEQSIDSRRSFSFVLDICYAIYIYIYLYIYIYIYMHCITPHFLLHLRQSIALPLDCPRSRWQSPGPGGSRGVAGREPWCHCRYVPDVWKGAYVFRLVQHIFPDHHCILEVLSQMMPGRVLLENDI